MEIKKKKLPIGIENFEKLRTEDFYYVDKTALIKDLVNDWAKVNLFTRPRRFGKSLNMSMLKIFFESDGNKEIFKDTEVAKEGSLCEEYMGSFSVISVSLKSVNAESYDKARDMMARLVNGEVKRFQYLLDSEHLTVYDKEAYTELLRLDMKEAALYGSLKVL